jgi:aryl sulfotransferase
MLLPQIEHIYQNHHLDSTRWQRFAPRDGDIVIASSIKSGTTWMQEIVRHLLFWGQEDSAWRTVPIFAMAPWLDQRMSPLGPVIEGLEAQLHRRFIKTHLPLDGLPYYPQVKYIVMGRDPRDVFMSFWNHYANYTDIEGLNNIPGRVGSPLPSDPLDLHTGWHNWITRGWFEWESEGYPFWGNMHHTQTWWNYRHLDNIHFVHYNDLLRELHNEIRRVADFLSISISDDAVVAMLPELSLEAMRRNGEFSLPAPANVWKEGPQTFFFKGTNGRWHGVLTDEELAMYEEKAARVLTSDCRAWLEQGRIADGWQDVLTPRLPGREAHHDR